MWGPRVAVTSSSYRDRVAEVTCESRSLEYKTFTTSNTFMPWQELITGLILTAVAVILTRRIWRVATGSSKSGCGTCSHCPTKDTSPPVQRVALEMDLGKDRAAGTPPN